MAPTCWTSLMLLLSHSVLHSAMSSPSRVILPEEGLYHLSSRATSVLLPHPLAPTIAVVLPAGIESFKSDKTGNVEREG